ncbi:MAG: hypothetical protein KDA41_08070 [Planctomycetales bacterium]|nr:hypothetical protein [Planctomycetales bacterium]
MIPEQININEDNYIRIDDVVAADDASYVTSGTASMTLKDAAGNEAIAATAMSYVSGTNGSWAGTFDKTQTASLVDGTQYFLEVTITSNGKDGFRRIPIKAGYHGLR